MREELADSAEIRDVLRLNPDDPLALRQLGRHSLLNGRYKEAQHHYAQAVKVSPHLLPEVLLDYERVINRDPAKLGPRFSLTGFEIVQGKLDAAILELEETISFDPKNVEAYNVLGRIYLKQGRIDDVIALLESSVKAGIKDVSLSEILAGAYLEKGRIEEAIRFYNDILRYKPGDKLTLRVLGELYTRTEQYNQAAQSFQAMFSDDPEVSREVMQRLESLLQRQEGNVFIREILAEIYMRSYKPEAAVEKLQEIMRLDHQKLIEITVRLRGILKSYPGHPPATLALAEALRRQGHFSEAIESYYNLVKTKPELLEEGIKGYQQVLEFCPEQVLARTYLAEAHLYKNQLVEALNEYEKIIEADPETAEMISRRCREISKVQPQLLQARLVLGKTYLVSGDLQRAVLEAEAVISADKRFLPAYLLLGEAYFKMKMCRKAVTVLGEALTLDAYNLKAQERYREAKEKEIELETEATQRRIAEDQWKMSLHFDLAKLYIQKGLSEEAIRELQIAVKDQARAGVAYNLLGCVYRGEGKYEQAAAQFNRALELVPAEQTDFRRLVRFNLGTTYEATGQVAKAIKQYESILQEELDFGNLKWRVKYLKATSLKSMQVKPLLLVIAKPGKNDLVVLWGREAKARKTDRQEEMSQSFGQTHNAAGYDYYLKGMNKAAFEEFQLAVQLDVKFAAALNNLAAALVAEGKPLEAKARLEDAVAIEPHSAVFHNNLGVASLLLGQLNQAQAEIEKAYTIDPELSAVCLNLGDLCYFKNDVRRAIDLYKRVGSFDPLAELAEERLRFKTPEPKSE
jgi:O-antigen biosynthesis protein